MPVPIPRTESDWTIIMFLGEYTHSFDSKNRLIIPAKFRSAVEEGMVITRGFDANLMVFTLAGWEKLAEGIRSRSLTEPRMRDVRRLLFSAADHVKPDRQGRVVIAEHLRQYAGIGDIAVVTGNYDYLEIWSESAWNSQRTRLERPDTPDYWNDLGF
jgi:MraZ protein